MRAHTQKCTPHWLWKEWGTVKTVDTDNGGSYLVLFITCRTFEAKTTPAAKTKTCFFSHLCQHSTPLSASAGLAVFQKGVLGVGLTGSLLTECFMIFVWMLKMTCYPLKYMQKTCCSVPKCHAGKIWNQQSRQKKKRHFCTDVTYCMLPSHHPVTLYTLFLLLHL